MGPTTACTSTGKRSAPMAGTGSPRLPVVLPSLPRRSRGSATPRSSQLRDLTAASTSTRRPSAPSHGTASRSPDFSEPAIAWTRRQRDGSHQWARYDLRVPFRGYPEAHAAVAAGAAGLADERLSVAVVGLVGDPPLAVGVNQEEDVGEGICSVLECHRC